MAYNSIIWRSSSHSILTDFLFQIITMLKNFQIWMLGKIWIILQIQWEVTLIGCQLPIKKILLALCWYKVIDYQPYIFLNSCIIFFLFWKSTIRKIGFFFVRCNIKYNKGHNPLDKSNKWVNMCVLLKKWYLFYASHTAI